MKPREWLINYCNETIRDERYRCKKHRQACKRCLDMLQENDKWYFDEDGAENIVKFFALLHHSKGVISGQSIILDGLSKFIVYNVYGFKYKKNDYRVFRKAFISMARKGQKSQLQAGIILYEMSVMATKWRTMNCCVCTGVSRKQSKVIFDECKLMLKGSILASKFKITRDLITHIKSGSTLEALSKEAKKDGEGGNIQLGVIDEWKDHKDTVLYEVIETGQKALAQPLLVIISTAGNDIRVPMYNEDYPYATKILDNIVENENYFTVICEVEENDDISDWKVWQKANQLLFTYEEGINGLKESYQMAKEVPQKLISFKVKNLNMWQKSNGKNAYINIDEYKKCIVEEPPIDIKGRDVYIGMDCSSKNDLFGITFHIPFIRENDGLVCIYQESYAFVPDYDKVLWHKNNDKQPFDYWYEQGWVRDCNNIIIRSDVVLEFCYKFITDNGFKNVYWILDPSGARDVENELLDKNEIVMEIYQSKKHLNDCTKSFRDFITDGRIYILKNDCLAWQISNAYIIEDDDGLIKIDKHKQKYRIDNVDSSIFATKLSAYWKPKDDLNKKILSDDWIC